MDDDIAPHELPRGGAMDDNITPHETVSAGAMDDNIAPHETLSSGAKDDNIAPHETVGGDVGSWSVSATSVAPVADQPVAEEVTPAHVAEEKSPVTAMEPMEKIATATSDHDQKVETHKTFTFADTMKHVKQSAKRNLYLHHRNRKDLTKQFTPGSVPKQYNLAKSDPAHAAQAQQAPEAQVDPRSIPTTPWQNIWIMFTTFPYWNMAFWSGWCYSIGSAFFVIDGFWSWVPTRWPETEFPGEEKYGVPLWFFFGAILYQIGGVMAYLEAVNDGSFAGAAMKKLLEGQHQLEKELLDAKLHTFFGHIVPHHHRHDQEDDADQGEPVDIHAGWKALTKSNSPEDTFKEAEKTISRRGGVDQGGLPQEGQVREYLTWRWWPTWHSLVTYHIYELGYIACAVQLFGVTLYGVTSIVILPGILDNLQWWQELGAYWWPQVIASCCFLIASIMFTIMAQDNWHKPKWGAVSWWIGIWAIIGSVGFLLCAIFGLYSNSHTWAGFQASVSSTWGSVFYMTSGLFQWYEAINVNAGPVLAFPNQRTPVLLRKRPANRETKEEV